MFLALQKSVQGGEESLVEDNSGGLLVGDQVPPELPDAGHSLSGTEVPQEPDDDDEDDDEDADDTSPSGKWS